ncbi:MAG: DUF4276 family protein [Sporomusaceae bacterium]|nr:DUF4276 family protein [Sporomusaceae bacterium]
MNGCRPSRSVKIYVEGGGDTNNLKSECRRAFSKIFESAGLATRMPRIVACGSRGAAYDDFCTALRVMSAGDMVLLLVDSEGPVDVSNNGKPWSHLKARDNWDHPPGATEDHVHLMVQCMENWFLADRQALSDFYGQHFKNHSLPANPNIEQIEKSRVLDGLEKSTRDTQKGEYGKGKHSFKILEKIDVQKIMGASPWAKRFFDELLKP